MKLSRSLILIQPTAQKQGHYVLYWMQASQRISYNHALQEAILIANQHQLPLLVVFALVPSYPLANRRHYQFMLEGIQELSEELHKLGISFHIGLGNPLEVLEPFFPESSHVVMDIGYMRIQRQWRRQVYQRIIQDYPHIQLTSVESDVIVPVKIASEKCEYGAYTLRPKLHRLVSSYAIPLEWSPLLNKQFLSTSSLDLANIDEILDNLPIRQDIRGVSLFKGGYTHAKQRLDTFIKDKLSHYLESNDPSKDYNSYLSPYLHFGQISSLEIYLAVSHSSVNQEGKDAFLEQLFVRRELAMNYVFYNEKYDDFQFITEPWAYATMQEHLRDEREYLYTFEQLEQAKTHDIDWNAAMQEMKVSGTMPNYMRMYWAKKIIEWTVDYQTAYQTIVVLNDTYFLDGRDPNSYTGIAWCFGKHDRAWTERPIFGKLRYMNQAGLLRKFDMETYRLLVEQKVKERVHSD